MPTSSRKIARVLVADNNLASRLTLQTVLEAGGYRVDSAASAAEAVGLLDAKEYELVLSDMAMEYPEAGYRVIDHARMKSYQPATAILTSSCAPGKGKPGNGNEFLVEPEGLPDFLGKVAFLISARASRRVARRMRNG